MHHLSSLPSKIRLNEPCKSQKWYIMTSESPSGFMHETQQCDRWSWLKKVARSWVSPIERVLWACASKEEGFSWAYSGESRSQGDSRPDASHFSPPSWLDLEILKCLFDIVVRLPLIVLHGTWYTHLDFYSFIWKVRRTKVIWVSQDSRLRGGRKGERVL